MTDIYDQASMQEEMLRDASIAASRNRPQMIMPKCECYNCSELLPPDFLFCDEHCRDDWQLRNPHK